jgi:hypothetical protein
MARIEFEATQSGAPAEQHWNTSRRLSIAHRSSPRERQGMLRIERIDGSDEVDVVFTLSGQIDDEPIAQLETMLNSETRARRIALDLRNVTLVNEDAIAFLGQCEAASITLLNCPAYVREWINAQRVDPSA